MPIEPYDHEILDHPEMRSEFSVIATKRSAIEALERKGENCTRMGSQAFFRKMEVVLLIYMPFSFLLLCLGIEVGHAALASIILGATILLSTLYRIDVSGEHFIERAVATYGDVTIATIIRITVSRRRRRIVYLTSIQGLMRTHSLVVEDGIGWSAVAETGDRFLVAYAQDDPRVQIPLVGRNLSLCLSVIRESRVRIWGNVARAGGLKRTLNVPNPISTGSLELNNA